MKKEEMFDRLVENGFDFLSKAIAELRTHPKYSVIHFHAAVELLVKARLMHEHWTLVISKIQEADWEKFVKGDFHSVTLEESNSRLKKIVRSGMSQTELESFKAVAKHRNKMVHFFHEDNTEKKSEELKHNIIKEQLIAWYFLHQLLTEKQKDVFSNWGSKISEIESSLRKYHEFLQVVFDNLKIKISTLKNEGVIFEICPSCHFEAQKHDEEINLLYESTCLVCGLTEKCLRIECPECHEVITFKEEGFATCESCGKSLEPEDVASVLIDEDSVYEAMKNGSDPCEANCSTCDGYHTVVKTENNQWLCASCFELFEKPEHCQWCNDLNTGDMSNSYLTGCGHCEGMIGWHKDDQSRDGQSFSSHHFA